MRRGPLAVAGLLAAAAVVAVVLVSRGGGHHAASPPAPGASTTTGTTSTATTKKKHAAASKPKPGSQRFPIVGIADNKPQTFSDPLFRSLGFKRARLNTPWNSIFTEPGRLAAWLTAARAAGIEPLVAFEHNRGDACPAQPCSLPPLAAYESAVRGFHQRYPWVTLIQPWNEVNSATQPTAHHPARAAAYYEAVKRICPGCTVPAADLLDSGNLSRWLRAFESALHGPTPRLWGLHNYSDVNRFRDSGTRQLLSLVPGDVWVTETGGIVSFVTSSGKVAFPRDLARAARATHFMFTLAARFPRIKRLYIYQWKIDFPGNRFDAGLVAPNGVPRPSLQWVRRNRQLIR